MKKNIFILLLTFTCVLAAAAQTKSDIAINTAAITTVLNNQAIAWNKGDIKGYMQGYWKNDSLKFIGKKGISYGWETTLKHYEKSYPDKATMGILIFEFLSISGRKDTK